jgi:hypothetical protein
MTYVGKVGELVLPRTSCSYLTLPVPSSSKYLWDRTEKVATQGGKVYALTIGEKMEIEHTE